MSEPLFVGGYASSRKASIFYWVAIAGLLALTIILFTVFPMCILLPRSPNPEELGAILPFCHVVPASLAALFVVCLMEYRRRSKVRVYHEGLLIAGRLIKWEDVDDVKILHKTHIDSEVEGAPVVGYGMHGVGYGYAPQRSITRRKYRIPIVQIFHKAGVETIALKDTEFWSFIKAVIIAAQNIQKPWLRKLEALDKAL